MTLLLLVLFSSGLSTHASVDDLELIFQEEGTDKQWRVPGHSYVHIYASMLGPWRHKLQSMLEIGIGSLSAKYPAHMRYWWYAMKTFQHVGSPQQQLRLEKNKTAPRDMSYQPGASLRSWRRYFSPQARVIGIDLDPAVVAKAKATPGVEAFVANASDASAIANVLPHDLDLIIDDGAHDWVSQQRTLVAVWPYLKHGGYYFIEDVDPDEFEQASLRVSDAQELMRNAGVSLIHPNPIGRARVAAAMHGGLGLDRTHLAFLRKPATDRRINVLSRLPSSHQ